MTRSFPGSAHVTSLREYLLNVLDISKVGGYGTSVIMLSLKLKKLTIILLLLKIISPQIMGAYDFSLNPDLIQNYNVRAIAVPNYKSLTVEAGTNINHAGGIVVFRVKGDCTINGSIITHGGVTIRSPSFG